MPKMSMKELNKFIKSNPDTPATKAIKEQLEETPVPEPSTGGCSKLTARPAQIRNTASDLVAEKINILHHEVLDGFKDICIKAITIGEILVGQKDALKHGEWFDWIDSQLEIGPRQVENYTKIYFQRRVVLESMGELAKTGVKPSIRKMLMAATKKDNKKTEKYLKSRKKNTPSLTPWERKQQRKDKKRNNEISILAKMYIAKEIDENSLRALALRWNRDNPDNYELFVEDVKKEAKQIDEERHPGKFNSIPSDKIDIMLSIDTDLWDDFVNFGGVEVYLTDYVKDFLTNYVIEQRSYRIAT